MEELRTLLSEHVDAGRIIAAIRGILLLSFGALGARFLGRFVLRSTEDHLGIHSAQLLRRAVVYGVLAGSLMLALREFGFDLSLLLGAAGILTIAVGFASQTSAANIVSGLFLIGERSFGLGDVIRVGTTTGEVLSIDLLSVKIRTYDNLYVRLPNETLIKSELTNLTRFAIRRIDVPLSVAYKEDLDRVKELLIDLADHHPLVMEEPRPLVIMTGYGDSGIGIQFSIWAARENFLAVRNDVYTQVRQEFAEQGIEIPFPQVSIHTGSGTRAFPLDMSDEAPGESELPPLGDSAR